MRFHLSHIRRAEGGAKTLKTMLAGIGRPETLTRCQAAVALALGYASWHELRTVTAAARHAPSPLDHDLESPALLAARRDRQATALAASLGLSRVLAMEIVSALRLTAAVGAARPSEPAPAPEHRRPPLSVAPRHLDDLGLSAVETWRSALALASGLCVVGGATGSGLTTTLRASARELARMGRRVAYVGPASDLPPESVGSFDPADHTSQFFSDPPHALAVWDAVANGADALVVSLRDPEAILDAARAAADGTINPVGCLVVAEIHSTPYVEDIVERLLAPGSRQDIRRKMVPDSLRCVMGQARVRVDGHGTAVLSEAVAFADAADVERARTEDAWWPTIEDDGYRHDAIAWANEAMARRKRDTDAAGPRP